MQLYLKDEPQAFDIIYARYKNQVHRYLSKRLKKEEIVNDVFQNTFVKFHKSRKHYDPQYALIKWIYTIARCELLDYVKKKKLPTIQLEDFHGEQHSNSNAQEPAIDLSKEKNLSKNEKEALNLRYYSDLDFIEISKKLETSESNTRKIISRGLKKLRSKYAGDQR